jgi:hypothetical protein
MIGRRASQRLWRVPQCQEARLRLTSRKRARERTISPQPAWGGALRAIRIVVPAASLNVLRTLAFTEAVAFASANEGEPPLVRRRSSRAHPAKPPPRPRGLVQCFPRSLNRRPSRCEELCVLATNGSDVLGQLAVVIAWSASSCRESTP